MDFHGDMDSLSDAQLLEMHGRSDTNEYLGVLFNRYTPLIYGVCLKYLRNVDGAADAVMDIFEQLAVKVSDYRINEFRTWVYSVTRNHCLQVLRRKGVEIHLDPSMQIMENDSTLHLLNETDDEARYATLGYCLDMLPEPQRKCIERFFFDNKSYADIVAETRYQLKSVKSYLQNGKRNLKICMEKQSDETD